MNPADAKPQDWGMYYDSCWMKHTTLGVGRIRVINGKLYFEDEPGTEDPKQVKARFLTCWWPRPGAHNPVNSTHAIYIARRAQRNMRKSAIAGDHYFVKWGATHSMKTMQHLRAGPKLVPLHVAVEMLTKKERHSIAVSRDIILTRGEDVHNHAVIFRGEENGTYSMGCYTPLFSDNPLTGRILRQLEQRV